MKPFTSENYISQLSIDCVIFGFQNKSLKVLTSKILVEGNYWSLPGGFILKNESIEDASKRILETRTGLKDIYLEQFRVFGGLERTKSDLFDKIQNTSYDSSAIKDITEKEFDWLKNRFISIGFYALVEIDKVSLQKGGFDELVTWTEFAELPIMIMDHNEIAQTALDSLRENLDHKLIGFNLLPETFTMRELQELYEAVYDKPFARNNFQKKMLDLNVLERLEKKFTGAANKAPYLYRFVR